MIVPEAGPAAKVMGASVCGCRSTLWQVDTFLVPLLTTTN